MPQAFQRKMIAAGFQLWVLAVRAQRRLRLLGRLRLRGLDHVTIPVHDLAAAQQFYCEMLGAVYFMRVDDETFRRFGRPPAADHGQGAHHVSVFIGGSTRVDLFLQSQGQASASLGHPHYAFEVPARHLSRWKHKLESHGIPVEGPLQLGPPGQASLYFNDPFGNHLEIVTLGYTGGVEIRPPVMQRIAWTHHVTTMGS